MLSQAQDIVVIWRDPFSLGSPQIESWKPGKTIAEIVEASDYLPKDFIKLGAVSISGHIIPRNLWQMVKPRPSKSGELVSVTFQMPVQGGGRNGGGKQIFALVAALALSFVTAGIAAGSASRFLGAAFAKGTIGSKLLAAGVSVVGGLVVSALTSVPTRATRPVADDQNTTLNPASIQGNVLAPNAQFPTVVGTRRIYPPFVSEPIVELIGQDEFVDGLLGLAGPHALSEVRVGDASAIDNENDLKVYLFENLPDSEPLPYPARIGRTFVLNTEMSVHGISQANGVQYDAGLPVYHAMTTADAPDESWLHIRIDGLIHNDFATEKLEIPFRIRMRKRGTTTWINFPELHWRDKSQGQVRCQIKFKFGTPYSSTLPQPPFVRGWVSAFSSVPAQNVQPLGTVFNANSYFNSGTGTDVYDNTNYTGTDLLNVTLEENTATFYLDNTVFVPGLYDVEIKRGSAFRAGQFTATTYTYEGSIIDFFGIRSNNTFPLNSDGLVNNVSLVRFVNIKHKPPLNEKNLALIYVTARNREVDQLSVKASGYVYDYVAGIGWTNLITTSNPAPHFRNILSGKLNVDPLPENLLWDASLVEWRQACIDNDYTCDMICEGASVGEILRIVASCGFASPYQSEIWGVIRDYDRSAEPVEQTFTSRNMADFQARKAFNRLPSGLRPNFKDENYEYAGKQIVVYRDDVALPDSRTEQVDYIGIVNRAKIIKRARIDLRQMQYRGAVYSWSADVGSLICRRGSLVAVSNDVILSGYTGTARIVQVLTSGPNITGFVLDSAVTFYNEPDMLSVSNMLALTDMLQVGLQTGISVRTKTGAVTSHQIASVTGDTQVTLSSPITVNVANYVAGNLVAFGSLGKEYKRLIVTEIQAKNALTATITAVDEAPQIWSNL